jgi:GDP-4-dehydro-6-deoxy-D-mannose reductase
VPGSSRRVLITGASGFAGRWLARASAAAGETVVGVTRGPVEAGDLVDMVGMVREYSIVAADLRDEDAVHGVVRTAKPDLVYHLAALSSVGVSWEKPAGTVMENVATAVNVLEAVRSEAPDARVVWVSTCEVYGAPSRLPISEDAPVHPASPYAVSKTAGDQLAAVYADAGWLDLIRVRPFNHAGPGQASIFITSSLARQAAEAGITGAPSVQIVTGNPDTRRDFTDVRDVVRAYRLLATSPEAAAGSVFNVCSGRSVSAAEQVKLLASLVEPMRVEHVVDPARVRAHEVMDLRGDSSRLHAATGWQAEIPFTQTMADTIEWWQRELRADMQSPPSRVRH